jgi:nicotinamidase-related amidase
MKFLCSLLLSASGFGPLLSAADVPTHLNEPWFEMALQTRVRDNPESSFRIVIQPERWVPAETVIIVCDMWNSHASRNAARRVGELAPRMNQVLEYARTHGALVIHAPSNCMKFYENHPARRRAQNAPTAPNLPADIGRNCLKLPSEDEVDTPLDRFDTADETPAEHEAWVEELKARGLNPLHSFWRQIETIKIHDEDAISDSGVEIWNLLEQRGIKNVVLAGVHLNFCVISRPFGLRQMVKHGRHVVLLRDLTDTCYNPARWPYVNHFRGTALYVEYVEKVVCPTVSSEQFIGGKAFTFAADPHAELAAKTRKPAADNR